MSHDGTAWEGFSNVERTRGEQLLTVTFYGVRGSTPCPCDDNRRYGGNTSCVALESPGHDPIALDLGTGLRFWGLTLPTDGSFRGSALVTHIHWDHVQGLPFFTPVLRPGSQFDVYGPPQEEEGTLAQAFDQFLRPPFFPVDVEGLNGDIRFHDVDRTDFEIDGAKVLARRVPHVGTTNGYRVQLGGATVAYLSDHQMPYDGSHVVTDEVLELCDGADLVIHDAQYTRAEFAEKFYWGHCTVDFAVHVAHEAGAKRLALFHHDPAHYDDHVDHMLQAAQDLAARTSLDEVIAAAEGLTIALGEA